MSAVVITPTTGLPTLADAIWSVHNQTEKVDHWIVVDGMENAEKTLEICKENQCGQQLIVLPENTGRPKRHHLGCVSPVGTGFRQHRPHCIPVQSSRVQPC